MGGTSEPTNLTQPSPGDESQPQASLRTLQVSRSMLVGEIAVTIAIVGAAVATAFVLGFESEVERTTGHRVATRWLIVATTALALLAALTLVAVRHWRRTAQRHAARVVESNQRFRMMADHFPGMVWMSDADGTCSYVNRGRVEFTGRSLSMEVGEGWIQAVHAEDLEQCRRTYREAFEARQAFRTTYRLKRHDGTYRWILDDGHPRMSSTGEFQGFVGTCIDVSDLHEAREEISTALKEQQRLLAREQVLSRELNHRVRNNLAGLLGLVSTYERTGRAGSEVAVAFRDKLKAIKEVHDLTSQSGGDGVQLGDLLQRMTSALASERRGRIARIDGPAYSIPAAQAASVAMVLQELFTNSLKHGVLGSTGELAIRWRVTGQTLTLEWVETGASMLPQDGAAPTTSPTAGGVGLGLIRGIAASDLRGGVCFRFDPGAMFCILTINGDPSLSTPTPTPA